MTAFPGSLRATAVALLFLSLGNPAQASPPTHQWSSAYGSSGMFESARDLAVDPLTGDVVIVGAFEGTVDFGGGGLVSAGESDIYIARFDGNGNHQWSARYGDTMFDGAIAVAIASNGDILLGGDFQQTVDFGGGPLIAASLDMFLVRLTSAGAHVWSQSHGISTGEVAATRIEIDSIGDIVVGGTYNGAPSVGGSALPSELPPGVNVFFAKYNAAGVHQWSAGFGGRDIDSVFDLAIDSTDAILATGSFVRPINFGGGSMTSAGSTDMFLVKFDAAGTHQWSQRFGKPSFDTGTGVAIDPTNDDVVLAGRFTGMVDFGGGPIAGPGGDAVLAKFDSSGTHIWSQDFGGTSSDLGLAVDVDASGNIAMAGTFQGDVDFGGGMISGGSNAIFLAGYESDGTHRWSEGFGPTGLVINLSVALHGTGDVFLAGGFDGSVDFGGGALTSAGGSDAFLAKYQEGTTTAVVPRVGYALHQNTPNPFNPMTRIDYRVGQEGDRVALRIFDLQGRLVRTLVEGRRQAGAHHATWDGRNEDGRPMPSGVYAYRLTSRGVDVAKQLVLIK